MGCGKTGLITRLPFGVAAGRVLVIAPNVTIRDELIRNFSSSNPKCFYLTSAALTDLSSGPHVAALDADANLSDLDEAHIAVTNIQQLAAGGGRWLSKLPEDYFDLILVDEAHHNAAASWQDVFERFPDAKVLSLTATPFRGDDQPVEGEPIYSYPIAEAMRRGFVKHIQASNVAPSELRFSYRGHEAIHTLEEVLRLKDRDWFSRGVALAEVCNVSIVDGSLEWLKHLRATGTIHHQIIAVACSVDHARAALRSGARRRSHEIHSKMTDEQKAKVLRDLHDGTLDVIVQVQMLGEGFDHPPLSVAAIFRPFRSLSPYIQFVGRVMRVNKQQSPGNLDNRGIVVSHVGLNLEHTGKTSRTLTSTTSRSFKRGCSADSSPHRRTPKYDGSPCCPACWCSTSSRSTNSSARNISTSPTATYPTAYWTPSARKASTLLQPGSAGRSSTPRGPASPLPSEACPRRPASAATRSQEARPARLNDQTKATAIRICTAAGLSPAGKTLAAKGGGGEARIPLRPSSS